MLSRLKEKFFSELKEWGGYIVAGIVAIFSVLVYMLKRKDEQLNAAKAKENLHEADKESAVIDTEVKHLEDDKKTTDKQIDKANTEVVDLQTEKEKALAKEKNRKPDQIEDYWNK